MQLKSYFEEDSQACYWSYCRSLDHDPLAQPAKYHVLHKFFRMSFSRSILVVDILLLRSWYH